MVTLEGALVLLVEDEPLIGMIMEACLQERGAEVAWATTDRAAYDILDRRASDIGLLIADINLREGTTGFDVARYARTRNPSLRILYMSGEDSGSLTSFGVPGADFLLKPATEQTFVAAVEAVLSRPMQCIQKLSIS